MSATYVQRFSLVPPAYVALARALSEADAGASGANMWLAEIERIATPGTVVYYASSGAMAIEMNGQPSFASFLPLDSIADNGTVTRLSPGQPDTIYAMCQAAGSPVTLATIQALLAAVIVTDQEWKGECEKLGLQQKYGVMP